MKYYKAYRALWTIAKSRNSNVNHSDFSLQPSTLEITHWNLLKLGAQPTLEDIHDKVSEIYAPAIADKLQVPTKIDNWRAVNILRRNGLLEQVESMIENMTGVEGDMIRDAWKGGAQLTRIGPTVSNLSVVLGLTSEQVDAMFIEAAQLKI